MRRATSGLAAATSPAKKELVNKLLSLQAPGIEQLATQVVQRDIHAEFQTVLALVGASIERWSVDRE